ncbi:MAG TPA: hypothetical protein VJ870_03005 [Amycolatopsis sp.]|nr:hypothetical protein [Amycolatopsis sp.]
MRNRLGRVAAAVLAGALLTVVAAPAAFADETAVPTTTSAAADTTTDTSTSTPTSTPANDASTASETSSSAADTTTTKPDTTTSTSAQTTESNKPSGTGEPTKTSDSATEGWPPDPYQDDKGYGIDLGNGQAAVIIACAAGEPKNLYSPQFDVIEGPFQEEQDGRYWDYLVKLHDGVSLADVEVSWTCGGSHGGDQGGNQGGGSASGGDLQVSGSSSDAEAWQTTNGGKAQIAYAPKKGVETGFGGTAQE